MPAGRPSRFVSTYHVPWAKSLARRGLTVEEIAKEIGVAKSTFCKWVSENQELSDALNEGRSIADSKVEDSLYRRAIGFKITERKTIVSAEKDGSQKPARIEVLERDVPPDTTACIYWLKNRRPVEWRDQSNISITTSDDDEKIKKDIEAILMKAKKEREGNDEV